MPSFHTILIFSLLCFTVGCAPKAPHTDPYQAEALSSQPGTSGGSDRTLSKVNSIFVATPQSKDASEVITPIVFDISRDELSVHLITAKKGASCTHAANEGADSCLTVNVQQFVERDGSTLGVTHGAAVSFSISLVRLSDQKEIWSGHYSFNDTPLTDNIFQFGANMAEKGGNPTFETARALFQKGLRDALRKLNDDRTKQFLR